MLTRTCKGLLKVLNIILLISIIWSVTTMAWDPKNYKRPSNEELKEILSAKQFQVSCMDNTEMAFNNEYWNNHEAGIYVDVISGEPLFSSLDKYDSGTGWPSFTKPISKDFIVKKIDKDGSRTEVRSKYGEGHLGHVFNDGPGPTHERYCMNSAALRFIPADKLEKEGYGEYLQLFNKNTARPIQTKKTELATFGAGCFWGVEHILEKVKGVVKTTVGYEGGSKENPTYQIVKTGESGYAEVVQVEFDPDIISYEALLGYFWRLHDPTTLNRQGVDAGTQYRSVIFYHNDEQRKVALASKAKFDKSQVFKNKAVTQIEPHNKFYTAEAYHQKYFDRNGGHVCHVLRPK